MKGLKYIIYDIDDLATPVLFSSVLFHRDVLKMLGGEASKVDGAGFVTFVNGVAVVTGGSKDLDCKSSPYDAETISRHYNL